MSLYYIVYHILILAALILSSVAFFKGYRNFLWISILLFFTLSVELLAEIYIVYKKDFTWAYHVFNIIEYILISLYIVSCISSKLIKKIVYLSVVIFSIVGFFISFFLYGFKGFPGININIEGLLLFAMCTYVLFNLEVEDQKPIYFHTNFWICSGILIFFGCTFFYNGIYTRLVQLDVKKSFEIFGILNKPLNITLYSFFIIGILCLPINKRFTIQ